MKQNIEIEYKILINQDIYNQIKSDYQYQIQNDYTQTNYYLTHPLLSQKKYMLRIREKENSFELTLKRPLLSHRLESNVRITKDEKEAILNQKEVNNEIFDILKKDHILYHEIENKYSLTTHRIDISLKEGILSLDENSYLGKKDYEIEFEVYNEKEGYLKFLEIIKPYSLEYTKNCKSKIQRVLECI